jgi:hypothetical protein
LFYPSDPACGQRQRIKAALYVSVSANGLSLSVQRLQRLVVEAIVQPLVAANVIPIDFPHADLTVG